VTESVLEIAKVDEVESLEQERLLGRCYQPLNWCQEQVGGCRSSLPNSQECLKDARLAAVIRPDEDSNRRGLNRGIFVELEVLQADAL
jgi:hypothetical protein